MIAVRDAEGGVAVEHEEVAVAGLLADQVDQAHGLLDVAGIRVEEDGVVLVALGRGDEEIGHVVAVQLALLLLHLVPLPIVAVGGMHLAEGLHRQEEDQLEVGHALARRRRAALQRGDETISGVALIPPMRECSAEF